MNLLRNIGFTLSGLASLYIAYITGTGDILNYINFSDPLGEMAFCIIALFMGCTLIVLGITPDDTKVPCSRDLDMEMANESENIQ